MLADQEMNIYSIHNEPIDEVSYIITITNSKLCLLIDPFNFENIKKYLDKKDLKPEWIILTHEHYDHIAAVNELVQNFKTKVACSDICSHRIANPKTNLAKYIQVVFPDTIDKSEMNGFKVDLDYSISSVDFTFSTEALFKWNGIEFTLKETPGHSPGSICILLDEILFSGDSLLLGNEVPLKLPGASRKSYEEITIPWFKSLHQNIKIYPGHGESFWLHNDYFN